jgi:hypothetical protein
MGLQRKGESQPASGDRLWERQRVGERAGETAGEATDEAGAGSGAGEAAAGGRKSGPFCPQPASSNPLASRAAAPSGRMLAEGQPRIRGTSLMGSL